MLVARLTKQPVVPEGRVLTCESALRRRQHRGRRHDAIVTPYQPGELRGLLSGGVPQISGARDLTKQDLALIRRMSALDERVALLEMTRHEFLNKSYRKERSTFSDGTTVTVDWDTKTVLIRPELKQ